MKNNYLDENYSINTTSLKLYYISKIGINFGWSQGMVFAEKESKDNKNSRNFATGGFILGYTFDYPVNISIGTLLYGESHIVDYTVDGSSTTVNTKQLDTKTYYFDLGVPISNNWEIIFGYNRYISKINSRVKRFLYEYNSNSIYNVSYIESNLEFSTFDIGIGRLY